MTVLKVLLGPMRLPFLLLTPCCVLLGIGTAAWTATQVSVFRIVLILLGAMAAHISVNALNEYFDFKGVGRKHFPIFAGTVISSLIYGAFLLLAYASIILGVRLEYLPTSSLIGLVTIVMAIPAFVGAYRYGNNAEKLAPYMTMNVMINLITPVLVATGLLIG